MLMSSSMCRVLHIFMATLLLHGTRYSIRRIFYDFYISLAIEKVIEIFYAPYVLFMWKEIIEYYHTRRMIQQCDLLIRYRQNVLDVNCLDDTPICRRGGVDIPKKKIAASGCEYMRTS